MNYEREWRNEDGTLKSDDELREICKTWNADTWERYLKEYEK